MKEKDAFAKPNHCLSKSIAIGNRTDHSTNCETDDGCLHAVHRRHDLVGLWYVNSQVSTAEVCVKEQWCLVLIYSVSRENQYRVLLQLYIAVKNYGLEEEYTVHEPLQI